MCNISISWYLLVLAAMFKRRVSHCRPTRPLKCHIGPGNKSLSKCTDAYLLEGLNQRYFKLKSFQRRKERERKKIEHNFRLDARESNFMDHELDIHNLQVFLDVRFFLLRKKTTLPCTSLSPFVRLSLPPSLFLSHSLHL